MKTKTKDYPVASIGKRIITNLINYGLLCAIGILSNFLILFFPFDWDAVNQAKPYNNLLFSGLFTVCCVLNFLVWFLLFILIPYWSGGKTFASCMTKCKLYCEQESKRFKSIFDHQGVFMLPLFFVMLFTSCISFAFNYPAQFINSVFTFNPKEAHTGSAGEVASGIMLTLLILSCIILCGNVVNVCINRNTSSLLDDQFKVYLIDYSEDTIKVEKVKVDNNDLPGKIDIEELEKL